MTDRFDKKFLAGIAVLACALPLLPREVFALQAASAAVATTDAVVEGGTVTGSVAAGTGAAKVPLPGVAITATNTLTGKKYTTATDAGGAFAMAIPKNGRYVLKAELAAFATATQEVLLNATSHTGVASFAMELQSRVDARDAAAGSTVAATASQGRGLQSLNLSSGADSLTSDATAGATDAGAGLPSIGGGDATDSVAVSGQTGSTNGLAGFSEDQIRERIADAMSQARANGMNNGDIANAVVGVLGGMMQGGPGGPGGLGGPGGGQAGGRGGARGGGGGGGRGNFRGLNPTALHGQLNYTGSNGALNATQYSITGNSANPGYSQNRFGASLTGSPYIPGLIKPSTKQFLFLNASVQRNTTPNNLYANVPTLAERGGDFSGLTQIVNGQPQTVPIYDPTTGAQFQCNGQRNVICANRLSPTATGAAGLLQYYPLPNVVTGTQTTQQNYQRITTLGNNSTQISGRFNRTLGQATGGGPFGGFGGGGGRGGGGRNARSTQKVLRQSINTSFSYSHSAADSRGLLPVLDGKTMSGGYNVSAGYTLGYGRFNNNASLTWNRSHGTVTNFFSGGTFDPAVEAGVSVPRPAAVSPGFYNGVPEISLNSFSGFSSPTPSDTIGQTISFTDAGRWGHGKHNFQFGADIRRIHSDSNGGGNALGILSYTGYLTAAPAGTTTTTGSAPSGSSFADFLLGAPQQSRIQAPAQKTYRRQWVWDAFVNDDYRVRSNVTLNFGLRYEYYAPLTEKNNHLVNLDHSPDFTAAQVVTPDAIGIFTGAFPRSVINPDRVLLAPRAGIAWRPGWVKQTVVRAGYGINYITGQPNTFARNLSTQPGVAITQTNTVNQNGCGTLNTAAAFNCTSSSIIQNNFAVNRFYRLGRVQVINFNIQRTLPLGIVANIGYNGSFGANQDILRAANSSATGVISPGVQPYTYEDSLGDSRFHALSMDVRKRLQKGVALGATYQYGHSIDNSSGLGGSGNLVAQDSTRLDREYGNSSFDVRHKLTGNYVFELPFGPNRAFLNQGGVLSKLFDGFSVSGTFTFATGSYLTPRYNTTVAQVNSGGNYTLRPDRVFTQGIAGAGTLGQWFNPNAFTAPANLYGTASRNSIRGPGTVSNNMSLARTASFGAARSLEARVTATNVFNTVQYNGVDTTVNSNTFGRVASAASPRQLSVQMNYRF